MIAAGVLGALGRMGREITALIEKEPDWRLAAAFERADSEWTGKSLIEAGSRPDVIIKSLNEESIRDCNGLIDFSSPSSTAQMLPLATNARIPVVIGTTGLNTEQENLIREAALQIPIVYASNMSLGVNLTFALVEQAARALAGKGYDTEVTEVHHRLKKDAPSGTARTLKEVILSEYKLTEEHVVYGREGMPGERKNDEVGVFSLRGGDVVGDHTVYFFGDGERIEIRHQAHQRSTFARGSLIALRFAVQAKPGLYNMRDILGI